MRRRRPRPGGCWRRWWVRVEASSQRLPRDGLALLAYRSRFWSGVPGSVRLHLMRAVGHRWRSARGAFATGGRATRGQVDGGLGVDATGSSQAIGVLAAAVEDATPCRLAFRLGVTEPEEAHTADAPAAFAARAVELETRSRLRLARGARGGRWRRDLVVTRAGPNAGEGDREEPRKVSFRFRGSGRVHVHSVCGATFRHSIQETGSDPKETRSPLSGLPLRLGVPGVALRSC